MWGFIIAIVAGFLTPYIEEPVSKPVAKYLEGKISLEPGELRVLSFTIVMLAAGIGAELLHSGSAFWVILGGVLGYFGTRLVALGKQSLESKPTE